MMNERNVDVMDNEHDPQQQQFLMMPWLALSDQIKMTNQRIDDLRNEVSKQFGEVDKQFGKVDKQFECINQRLDKMDAKLDKRVDRLTTIVLTVAGILVTFFVTYLTLRG